MQPKRLFPTRLVMLTLCASLIVPMFAHAQSAADCAAKADRAARDSTSAMGGAVAGGAGGALFGAIVGDSRKSARRGAALGAVVGGAKSAHSKDQTYKRVYDNCMAGN